MRRAAARRYASGREPVTGRFPGADLASRRPGGPARRALVPASDASPAHVCLAGRAPTRDPAQTRRVAADDETNVPPSGRAEWADESLPGVGDVAAGLPLPPATAGQDAGDVAGLGVLVADRDAAVAARLTGLLREAGAGDVAHRGDQEAFLQAVRSEPERWHVVLWHEDLEPDARRRLGLLNTWQREFPRTAVVLTTDALTSASTLTALRGGAVEIVSRTASGAELAAVVRHAHEAHRLRHAPAGHPEPPRMLVVGAHPDDGEIGAGGLIHRRVRDGWEITMLAMSHGSFGGDPDRRVEEARRAAAVLGASFRLEDFPDGHITDETETVQAIERTVADVSPDVVLVHSEHDTHQDHRAVHRATLVASRRVPRIACYQSPSATVEFRPNRFIGLREADVEAKLDAIRAHRSQADTRAYLDEDLILSTARYWGRFTGDVYVEPLEVVRYSAELERSLV